MAKTKSDPKTKSGRKASDTGRSRKYLLYSAAGAGLLGVGAAYFLYREKSIEKPNYRVVEEDGDFEIREYPELIVAETVVQGDRAHGLDQGFARLADYIFARHREGEKVAMTAPVLFSGANGGGWTTRFVMPALYDEQTLPAPDEDINIVKVPARRVAALRFAGAPDNDSLREREAQLESWVGAKKLKASGSVERAFYNSPRLPGPLRRTEVLVPID